MHVAGAPQELKVDDAGVQRVDRPHKRQDRPIVAAGEDHGQAGGQRPIDDHGRDVDAPPAEGLELKPPQSIVADDADESASKSQTGCAGRNDRTRASDLKPGGVDELLDLAKRGYDVASQQQVGVAIAQNDEIVLGHGAGGSVALRRGSQELARERASDTVLSVQQPERLAGILERLSDNGTVNVGELAETFDVSLATIRRDLGLLEEQRLIGRVHGGAVARGVLYELPLRYKAGRQHEEKQRISQRAAAQVTDHHTVGFTGGTTTTEVARALAERPGLTVVTNALNIASELAVRVNLKIVVPGGVARPESYELVGPIAEAGLEDLNLDLAFVGVDGISATAGCTTHHEVEAYTNRALISRATRVVVVADSSKLGRVAFARICSLADVDELITDTSANSDDVHALEATGLLVTRV